MALTSRPSQGRWSKWSDYSNDPHICLIPLYFCQLFTHIHTLGWEFWTHSQGALKLLHFFHHSNFKITPLWCLFYPITCVFQHLEISQETGTILASGGMCFLYTVEKRSLVTTELVLIRPLLCSAKVFLLCLDSVIFERQVHVQEEVREHDQSPRMCFVPSLISV